MDMSVYAVVDPTTGDTVKEYPTISDEELRDAIARAVLRAETLELGRAGAAVVICHVTYRHRRNHRVGRSAHSWTAVSWTHRLICIPDQREGPSPAQYGTRIPTHREANTPRGRTT